MKTRTPGQDQDSVASASRTLAVAMLAASAANYGLNLILARWMDLAAFCALGGFWFWAFLGRLLDGPLVPSRAVQIKSEAKTA